MAKIRIHELAKELGLENKRILEMCLELSIADKKSHSSSLSDEEAESIRRYVIRSALSGGNIERELVKEGEVLTERRMAQSGVIRRRRRADEPAAEESLSTEQSAKQTDSSLPSQDETASDGVAESIVEQSVGAQEASLEDQERSASNEFSSVSEQDSAIESLPKPVKSEGEQIAELREKHDIRAPKILGKIELPVELSPQARKAAAEAAEEAANAKKKAKGKTSFSKEKGDLEGERKFKKKKQILQKVDLLDYDTERNAWRPKKDKKGRRLDDAVPSREEPARVGKKVVRVDGELTVGELAKQLGEKIGDVIGKLMSLGVMATINKLIDFDTATLIASEYGAECTNVGTDIEEEISSLVQTSKTVDEDDFMDRPPIVTVMGHVDHGKTSLLDAIRSTAVTKGEFGGITQHIGAYSVMSPSGGHVTFLDTPGHEAFTAMRSRGAQVTDVVILVVAADDGVMPQTIEAINHAKAANVPIVVAINKIDKEGANLDRIKNQLSEQGLIPEDWGGQVIMVPVSAKTRVGLDQLLESVLLQAEVLELKANPKARMIGTVIESELDRGRGAVMTVLVQNGTLKRGDIFVAGAIYGKVRALIDDHGKQIQKAGPSTPVEILGASSVPMSGDDFIVLDTEAQARSYAEIRQQKLRNKELTARAGVSNQGNLTLESLSSMIDAGELKELPIVVKADVQGSVEAVAQSLERASNDEVKIKVIHKGVGAVTENDVQLASASKGIIVAFNVRADSRATPAANSAGVEILYSRIIYEIIEQVQAITTGMLKPQFREKSLGRVEVRTTFKVPKLGLIAGSYVLDGVVERGASVRLLRDSKVVFEGKMASLRRFKDDVREVSAGYECGIGIDGYNDIKEGDVIEVFKVEEIKPGAQMSA